MQIISGIQLLGHLSNSMSKVSPLSKIIGLSSVLAVGFLFIVLAGAIFGNWSVLIIGLTFACSYLPVIITNGLQSHGFYDDLMNESTNQVQDLGRFVTSFMTVSAIALPIILHHCHTLAYGAAVMTEIGGAMVMGTVVVFTRFFDGSDDDNVDF